MYIHVTLITFAIISTCYGQDWIDPYEMVYSSNRYSESKKSLKSENKEQVLESKNQNPCAEAIYLSHYKRLINVILKSATKKTADDLAYEGKLLIEIPIENYNVLKEFATSNGDVSMLRNIDEILSNVLLAPSSQTSNRITEALVSWKDYLHFQFYNTNTLICLCCIFVLLLSYKLLTTNVTLGSVFKYLIFLGWVIDFSFCWIKLLQEAEINSMVALKKFGSIPANCDPKKVSAWTYIVSFFYSSDDCKEYHQVLYKDQFYSISPLVVFSHQMGILVYTPASSIGEALGSFTSGILAHLPWGVNVILLPLLLVFAAIIVCIGLTFLTGTSLSVGILGIFNLTFGKNSNIIKQIPVRDTISGDNLSALLSNLPQRNIIEDVRPAADICISTINSQESNLSNREVESDRVEDLKSIELKTNILETKNSTKTTDKVKENEIHDGSGDSK